MPIVAVSFKMYFEPERSCNYIQQLCSSLEASAQDIQFAVLPDFLSLPRLSQMSLPGNLLLGAQDICQDDRGAFTGEVSGADLAALGVKVAELGHAERRRLYGETTELITAKFAAAIRNGMIPLLCVGEEAEGVPHAVAKECAEFVRACAGSQTHKTVWVAYEPQWAIGAPHPAPPEYVRQVCDALRTELSEFSDLEILYGGSAGPGLISRLYPSVDGLFLGRFAHDPEAFLAVAEEFRPLLLSN